MTTFEYASSKLGKVDPETRSIAKEIFDAAQKAGHDIWFMWGKGSGVEHATGNALDLMVRNAAGGTWIRNYIWTNRARLRLKHVIWDQKITSTVYRPGVVVGMADRGNSTANHKDHVHVLFFPGEYRPVPPPAPPKPAGKTVSQLADEVLAGKWGNGDTRRSLLKKAGHNPDAVQAEVNRKLGIIKPQRKSNAQLANEVILGKWGNGDTRKSRLRAAGYDPAAVQAEVNRKLG
jgi:hypothetical protein